MATIVLVVADAGSLTTGDTILRDRLVAAGHSVVLRSDEQAEYGGSYDGVMVSDSCSGGTVGSKYDTAAKPGITLENVSWRLGTYLGGVDGTDWAIENVDGNAGLTGTHTVYDSAQSQQGIDTDTLPAAATVVARLAGDADHGTYVTYEAGQPLTSGNAPARRVFLRIGDGAMDNLTATGTALLDAAIEWAYGPAGPIEKSGGDTARGTESGGVTATASSGETAVGTESGSAGPSGSEEAVGEESGYVAEGRYGTDEHAAEESGETSATNTSGETAVAAETYDTEAEIDPPLREAIAEESGHIAIPGGETAIALDAHEPPTEVTSTPPALEVVRGQEGGYVVPRYAELIITLFAVDPEDGTLTVLPDYKQLRLSRTINAKGAIQVDYPADGRNFDLLRGAVTDNRDLEIEIWSNGSPAGALRGYLQEASGDDVAEDGNWTFAGSFLEVRTDETIIYPQDRGEQVVDPDTGELTWTNPKRELVLNADTPGAVMATLWQQAQARDALDDIDYDFTTELDSNGDEWEGTITGRFSPGTTYTQMLDRMVELGLCEWAIVWDPENQRKTLKLWNPDSRGVDLTEGIRPVVLRRGKDLLDAPRKWSVREAGTHLLAAGSEGLYKEADDDTALARRDRRVERYASLNNAADEGALLAFAQAELTTVVKGLQTVEHGIGMLPGEPRPLIAYDIGDWVYSMTSTSPEKLRVMQWEVAVDDQRQLTGRVALNDLWRNAMEKLRRQLNAIQSGEAVVGTSEPSPGTEDRTPPAAPDGLTASSIAYTDPAHTQPLAMVTVGWNAVTTNADGADNPLVQAAVFILDKIEDDAANPPEPDPDQEDGGPNYDPFDPDTWTWKNCPQIVQDFAGQVRDLWVEDGSPDPVTDWLEGYIAEQSQTPTAAEDVAGYLVRYSFLGLEQVGGIPSSDPFPEEGRAWWYATPPDGTSSTSFSFGGVDAGSRLRIEVCAFDRAGNQGAWSTLDHDCVSDTTPPPVPSTPSVKTWFRTLDVTWDGLGSEGEEMPHDFAYVRVWVGQGADMTLPGAEEEPLQPTAFDPTETAPQFVATLHAGGTWNIPDLPLDVGWYACLQSVDTSGNVSERSEVAGPVSAEQLVSDDLVDDIIDATKIQDDSIQTAHIVDAALTSAKIADASIIRAKIADLAVNDAKIETISAGKIITGTLEATVTLSGTIQTSGDSSANRVVMDSAGIRLYKGSSIVGDWKVSDGTILITGTYRSGTTGQRINIDPDGTMSFYASSGANPSRIKNEGNDIVWRGPLTGGKSGRLNVNTLGVGINYGDEDDIPASEAEFLVLDRQTRMTAPFMNFQVDQRKDSPVGGFNDGYRVQFSMLDDDGDFISRSGISYAIDNDGWGGMAGNDTGWKLAIVGEDGEAGRFVVTSGTLDGYGVGWALGWDNPSSGDVKEDVEDARALLDPLETIKNARARKFRYKWSGAGESPRVGVIAEELPEVLHRPIVDGGERIIGLSVNDQVGVLWGAINQILDQEIVSTSAIAVLDASGFFPPDIFPADATAEVEVTWESSPPAAPTGGFVQVHSSFLWAGKVAAWIKTGSTTDEGCTVVFKNISGSAFPTNPDNDNTRVSATVIGLGLYTPPYEPPEE